MNRNKTLKTLKYTPLEVYRKESKERMATFIDLDSVYRDREYPQNSNPFSYELTPSDVQTWFSSARQVRAHPQNKNRVPLEFVNSVRIKSLTVPYSDELFEIPRVYVEFKSNRNSHVHLIQTIQGVHKSANFICQFSHVQVDRNGAPLWIHYRCDMEQVMRFDRDYTYKFEITVRDGSVPPNPDNLPDQPANPLAQTLCTFEIMPYIRDGDYDNHLLETHTQ